MKVVYIQVGQFPSTLINFNACISSLIDHFTSAIRENIMGCSSLIIRRVSCNTSFSCSNTMACDVTLLKLFCIEYRTIHLEVFSNPLKQKLLKF